jgi:hypothetical protein
MTESIPGTNLQRGPIWFQCVACAGEPRAWEPGQEPLHCLKCGSGKYFEPIPDPGVWGWCADCRSDGIFTPATEVAADQSVFCWPCVENGLRGGWTRETRERRLYAR